jgi:phage tail-like protein
VPANDKEAHVPVWFTLKFEGVDAAGFWKEATGFDSESEVVETKRSRPNGRGDVVTTVGATKWGDIELKRGVDQDKTLWNWRKMVIDGNLKEARKDLTITMLDFQGQPVVTYSIIKAWP